MLRVNKGHTGARSKLYIDDFPIVPAPVHIASDDMAIAQYFLHVGDMTQSASALNIGLQVDNRAQFWSS